MFLAKSKLAHLFIFSTADFQLIAVPFDENFIEKLVSKLEKNLFRKNSS
jgi:hypothetical protein